MTISPAARAKRRGPRSGRGALMWLGLVIALLLAAVVVSTVSQPPPDPLSTTSSAPDGSKAAAAVLRHYGTNVHATQSIDEALDRSREATVLVTAPDAYSGAQLRRLRRADLLVLIRPDTAVLAALHLQIAVDADGAAEGLPGCADDGADAAGRLAVPTNGLTYSTERGKRCYGGLLVTTPDVAVLGSGDLLRNDRLGRPGDAAVIVNTVTRNRTLNSVVWLRPGDDAAGNGPVTIWALFPDGVQRAFWWLTVLVLLIALWRGRRLGGVVTEPLPVVVRSAELVEGHGRLYERAGARDRAAHALREATAERLRSRLGLPRGSAADQIAAAAEPVLGETAARIAELLTGPPPDSDGALRRLAVELAAMESSTGRPRGVEREQ